MKQLHRLFNFQKLFLNTHTRLYSNSKTIIIEKEKETGIFN